MGQLTSYFIPQNLRKEGGIERRRAELTVKTVFVLIIWGPIMSGLYWEFIGAGELAAVLFTATCTTALAPFLLRWTGKPPVAGNFMLVPMYVAIIWVAWFNGGLHGPSASWLTILPIFALLFAGIRSAIFWLAISLLAYAGLFGLHLNDFAFPQVLTPWQETVMRLVEMSGLVAVVFGVVYLKDDLQEWLVERVRAREADTRAILETAPDGILTLDADGQIQAANRAAAAIFERPEDQLEGRHLTDLVPTMEGNTAASGSASFEASDAHIGTRPDGGHFPMEIASGAPGEEASAAQILVLRDITERKAAQQQLERARDEALEASRAKSAFLANMSHELRTPLNAVIGYSEMITEEIEFAKEDDAPGVEFIGAFVPDLRRIRTAGKHLLAIVNDILDLSKIEAGKMQTHVERIEIADLLDDVASTVSPLARKNDNQLVVDIDDELDAIRSDATKLRQILFNLLSNACKFTSSGDVKLSVDAGDAGDQVVFQVADTGIGMSEEQLEKVFEAFTQADDSTTREFGGTGLGLTITHHFTALLGGDIEVESTQGEGTVFTVRLPRELDSSGKPSRTEAQPVGGLAESSTVASPLDSEAPTILVVDDDATMRDLLTRILEREGYNVATAASGSEGLLLAEQLEPAAITLDVMMPSMDGWTMLSKLKQDPALATIPVVMVTMVSERSRGFALGADHYLVKPVDRTKLVDILSGYRRPEATDSILLVEDDEPTRELMRRVLDKDGWEVIEAEDGQKALDRLETVTPRMVILDLMMPQMDGFEFLERFRAEERWRDIPVVVVTAKELTAEDHERLDRGVSEILGKGGRDRDQLLDDVRQLVDAVTAAV